MIKKQNLEIVEDSDHDLLIEMNTILSEMKVQFTNHLQHHSQYLFYSFTVCVGLIVTLITLLITMS